MYVRFVLEAPFFSFHMEHLPPLLVIATRNPAKQKRYLDLLKDLSGIRILSLSDYPEADEVQEPFHTSEENSLFKAIAYTLQLKQVVLSTDESLFVDFLSESEQPGAWVRRTKQGETMTDEEILAVWSERLATAPETAGGWWTYAVTLAAPHTPPVQWVYRRDFFFLKQPKGLFEKGYPLSSLCIDKKIGKTYSELTAAERRQMDQDTFLNLEENVKKYLLT